MVGRMGSSDGPYEAPRVHRHSLGVAVKEGRGEAPRAPQSALLRKLALPSPIEE